MDLLNEVGESLATHLRSRYRPVPVFVVPGATHPEESAAKLGREPGGRQVIGHRSRSLWAGFVLPEKLGSPLEDLNFILELSDTLASPRQLGTFRCRYPGPYTAVDLALANPIRGI